MPAVVFLIAQLLLTILLPQSVKSLPLEHDHNDTVHKPFRVFWNVPYGPCLKHSPHLHLKEMLASFGIEADYNQETGTEAVTIFYSTHLKWPYVQDGVWFNGGLPQYADVASHLSALRHEINVTTRDHFTGPGVLDMELFRPALYSHFGQIQSLKQLQLQETAKLYPNITSQEKLRAKAMEIFETGARTIMEETLLLAKKLRPDMEWGYYGYPQHSMIGFYDDRFPWLWNISTAIYPSLYIYDRHSPSLEIRDQETISETYRVRAKYGDPHVPIYAYQRFNDKIGLFYNETLHHILDATIKKGVDGVVIWGSSSFFHNNRESQCEKLASYVQKHLGPQVTNLRGQMTACSQQLCLGHGRCVAQFYVGKIAHILGRGGGALSSTQPEVPLGDEVRPDERTARKEFLDHYACQCYKNWYGRWCGFSRRG